MNICELWLKHSCEQFIDDSKTGERIIYKNGFVEAIAEIISNPAEVRVMLKAEFTPIVAHVVIKNKEAENKLEQILNGNEFYIDYTQSLTSYKAEQK